LGGILKEAGETEEADACYQQVNWLQHQGSLPSSSVNSSSSEAGHNKKAIALSEQAELAMAHGDLENALEHYRAAFAQLKGNQTASTNNSEAPQNAFSMVPNQAGNHTNGIANAHNGNSSYHNGNSADSVHTLERRASACLEAGDWDRCLVACQELLERAPQYGNGYKLLGQARYGKGEFSQALEAYRKAISLNPQEVEARIWCGQILASQEQWQEAIAYYRQALQQDSQRWEVYHLLGDALQASGDIDGAIAAYEKATQLAG
jgi:tetratricopeptide (TPR) repeat protein